MSELTDLIRRVTLLERRLEKLVEPEVGGWVDISADVSLYQNAAVAATVNYAESFVQNKKATVILRLTATAAGAAGVNIYVLLPTSLAPASGPSNVQPLGEGFYLDGITYYTCGAFYRTDIGGLPAIGLRVSSVTGGGVMGGNPNIAVASDDVASFDITFEIA